MDEEGVRLSKKNVNGGEVDYKTKSGTAWSHSFLNQKPWHPLSYPNQRRKWIAEQTNAQHERRAQEIAREYAQEQEFFRQAALVSKKEKEKMENLKAVSFMYIRPPGYDAESAKAAEEKKPSQDQSPALQNPVIPDDQKKKVSRPKDVFGRALPTEEQFEALKNAPKLETGIAGRARPFGIEIRNVKCVRCGTFGHQSGDRECPLKDSIMPNEESRLKRDDPLTTIIAQTESSEALKWELKQKPGMSPPRGGFRPDDPNQQIVTEDDIFDEYGGFLDEELIPNLLANFSTSKQNKSHKRKYKGESSDVAKKKSKKQNKSQHQKKKKRIQSESSSSDDSEADTQKPSRSRHRRRNDRRLSHHHRDRRRYSDSSD